jgi:hypothetical protein
MRCKDEPEDLPAWIIDELPTPSAPPLQPWLEVPTAQWTDPPDPERDAPPRGTGGTVIVIDL